MEHNRAVDAVEKLGAEGLLQLVKQVLLHPVVGLLPRLGFVAARSEADSRTFLDELGADIAGHDNHAVAEIDTPALGIGQVAVIEYLEEQVKNVRVGLFNLVQQYATV